VHKFEFTKDYCLELLSKFPKKQLFNNTKAFLEYNKCFLVQIIMTREKIDISKGTRLTLELHASSVKIVLHYSSFKIEKSVFFYI